MIFRTTYKYHRNYFPSEIQAALERQAIARGPEFYGRYLAMRAIRELRERFAQNKQELARRNHIADPDLIQVGQGLVI